MARQRKRPELAAGQLEMTPMIDVVFQLLIYLIVTIKPIDVITNLDVFRPAPDKNAPKDTPPPNLVRIGVYQDGYTVVGRSLGEDGVHRRRADDHDHGLGDFGARHVGPRPGSVREERTEESFGGQRFELARGAVEIRRLPWMHQSRRCIKM